MAQLSLHRPRLSFFALCLTVFNDYLGFATTITIFAPLLLSRDNLFFSPEASIHTRTMTLGFLLASYPLAQFLAAPFIGVLSDHYGRRPILLITLFVSLIAYILAATAIFFKSLALLFVARTLGGFVAGNVSTASAAIADMSTEETKAKNISYLTTAVGMGFIFGAVIGGKLTDSSLVHFFNDTTPFLFVGVMFLLNFLAITCFFEETHRTDTHQRFQISHHFSSLTQAFRLQELRSCFLIFFLAAIGINFFVQSASGFLTYKYHLEPPEIGNYYGLVIVGLLIATLFLIRPLSRRFSLERLLLPEILGLCFFAYITAALTSAKALYFTFLFYGVFNGLFNSTLYPLASNRAKKENQGKAFGILASLNSIAQVFAPTITGFLLSYHPDIPLLFSGTIFFITFVISFFLFPFEKAIRE